MLQGKVSISVNIGRFPLNLRVKRDVPENERQTDNIQRRLSSQQEPLQELS